MNRRLLTALGASALLVSAMLPMSVAAADPAISANRLDQPITTKDVTALGKLDRSLLRANGRTQVVVRLSAKPVATMARRTAATQKKQFAAVKAQQTAVVALVKKLDRGARVGATTQRALNAIVVTMSAKQLAKLAADKRVLSINPVHDYQLDLSETVPYIGATAVQNAGFDGTGIQVAVLDSGVDYTHAAFGGPGDITGYKNAYGVKTKDTKNTKINDAYKGKKLYPTSKVIGGWDFVGEAWTGGAGSPPLAPDPDPIDCSPSFIGCGGGHGTHVADIIAGELGVAPGAQLYAIKVCSSITTSCSGVALIEGMDFALDPNGDGSVADRVDLINMSLGSDYGQSGDDDLSQAVEFATAAGTLVVASAGNGGDKPYKAGTPASAPGALSVAQTATPSSTGFAIFVSTGGAAQPREAVFQSWSKPLDFTLTNVPIQYGDGAGGNLNGCVAFPAGSVTGEVVLVDRGVCNFSEKIANVALGGGAIAIIGLITTDDPFDGSLGICPSEACHNIPGYMVSQATANLMKNPAARASFDPNNGVPLIGHMVGSSSRGPDNLNNLIKPEIGAPGASVSAEVGTGTGTTPFGGTSGAAPMVTGSAALLRDAFPGRSPLEIKAVLMNTAETDIMNRPAVFGGEIAPITRIGGGEVRVDRALGSPIAAWVDGTESAAVSFGFHDVSGTSASVTKTIRVRNYSNASHTFDISSTFRFANDAANGAVSVSAPASVTVAANGQATFDVTITVTGSALRAWSLNSGAAGASASTLQLLEYDGYLWLNDTGTTADDADPAHLPWQALPRKSGSVAAGASSVVSGGSTSLTNSGVGTAQVESFSLIVSSPDDPATGLGDNVADVDLRYAGFRSIDGAILGCDSPLALQFAVNTWDRQLHSVAPATFEFDLDTNGDGTNDWAVINLDLGGLFTVADGRNVTYAIDLATGDATAFWFTGHSTNSGNTTLTICGEQIGIATAADIPDEIGIDLFAVDWYNSGLTSDQALGLTIVPGADRYTTTFSGSPFEFATTIGAGAAQNVTATDNGTAGTSETGVLLLTDWSLLGTSGAPQAAEAITLGVTPAP
ncbi:MAG TPA: S8 family serine peptidase [Candidatus Limnocylindrales bacterium]|nr:S8 family serine peptidase [Candidatus Limnocylindrales bacterium]